MRKIYILILLVCLVSVSGYSVPSASAQTASAETNYISDLVMGVLWQQNSGEYSALCYQAFNAGKNYLLSLTGRQKRAVVMDLDETVLDNSMYAAWMIMTDSGWSAGIWEEWCNAAEAYEVPGSLDFANFVISRDIELFYVSNRPASVLKSTIENLKLLGFPNADEEHVFLMDKTSDKKPRLEKIKNTGYEIVLLAGDNLDDFDSEARKKSNAVRRSHAYNNAGIYGEYYIVLPNPVYGSFEAVISENHYALPFDRRAEERRELLKVWQRN